MKRPNESLLARRLLQTREQGYGFALFYRRVWKAYLFLAVVYAVVLTALAQVEFWPLFHGFVGAICAVLLRDIAWVRGIRKNWPFSVKVTDWDLVKKIAEEGAEAAPVNPPSGE